MIAITPCIENHSLLVRWQSYPTIVKRKIPMKLRKLHIEDYKMFKDFDIDFLDENDEALPIVVLAGVNGSGKTTILEYIYNFLDYVEGNSELEFNKRSDIGLDGYLKLDLGKKRTKYLMEKDIRKAKEASNPTKMVQVVTNVYYDTKNDIFYLPSGIDDTKKVADEFVKTFYFYLKEKDYRPSEITEYFNQYMKDIFNDLDIGFKYSHLDKEDNVWFTSNDSDGYYYTNKDNGEKVLFTIDELSTGQKTLLSKILYIYFKDYKDKVILIDEPELSLHPKWQSQILSVYEKLAEKNNCQIIIATHSPHIIGSAKPEYLRVLKKVDDKIEVAQYAQSYGLKFSQILTEIMGVEHLRTPVVDKKIHQVEEMIVQNKYDNDEFSVLWSELEKMLGKKNLDLKLLKLEIASRKKNVSNN